MKNIRKKLISLLLILLTIALTISCAPMTAEENEADRKYYEKKYADEPAPSPDVEELLELLDTCVGGQYIFGGQGDRVTQDFIDRIYKLYPDYFSDGRLKYFTSIAEKSKQKGWDFPKDYCWDCSGLWWYCCNKLKFYEKYTDHTASETYFDYCTPITKDELIPGDITFVMDDKGDIVHMGIVGREGYIYEAACSFVGVVKKRTVDKRVYNDIIRGGVLSFDSWNLFGRPVIFQ